MAEGDDSERKLRELTAEVARLRAENEALRRGELDSLRSEDADTPVMLAAAQTELRERETRFRAVFDGALDAMLIADDDANLIQVNHAAEELLGRSAEELQSLRVGDILAPGANFDLLWTGFIEEGEMSGEIDLTRPDGTLRNVEFRARAAILPGRHLSVLRDVTERYDLHRRLRHSQKMEALGRLAGGIAHDFNNMLSAILGFAGLLEDDVSGEAADDLDQVRRAAERAAALTRQLLVFSRHAPSKPRPINLSELVDNLQRMLGRIVGEAYIMHVDLADDLPPINADPVQLEQVVMNLVVNAKEALGDGGELRIETRLETASGRVLLVVEDEGVGMDAQTLDHIFDPYFTTKERGTGLGLSTVYAVVEQMLGTVTVDSESGRGTRFTISFPPVRESDSDAELESDSPVESAAAACILVVEDDPLVRRLVTSILQRAGHEVLAAQSADEAIAHMKHHGPRIDMLVSDVVMPGRSGFELARLVRADHPELRILFTSGYPRPADGSTAEPDAEFLMKPFTPAVLLRTVRELLGRE